MNPSCRLQKYNNLELYFGESHALKFSRLRKICWICFLWFTNDMITAPNIPNLTFLKTKKGKSSIIVAGKIVPYGHKAIRFPTSAFWCNNFDKIMTTHSFSLWKFTVIWFDHDSESIINSLDNWSLNASSMFLLRFQIFGGKFRTIVKSLPD